MAVHAARRHPRERRDGVGGALRRGRVVAWPRRAPPVCRPRASRGSRRHSLLAWLILYEYHSQLAGFSRTSGHSWPSCLVASPSGSCGSCTSSRCGSVGTRPRAGRRRRASRSGCGCCCSSSRRSRRLAPRWETRGLSDEIFLNLSPRRRRRRGLAVLPLRLRLHGGGCGTPPLETHQVLGASSALGGGARRPAGRARPPRRGGVAAGAFGGARPAGAGVAHRGVAAARRERGAARVAGRAGVHRRGGPGGLRGARVPARARATGGAGHRALRGRRGGDRPGLVFARTRVTIPLVPERGGPSSSPPTVRPSRSTWTWSSRLPGVRAARLRPRVDRRWHGQGMAMDRGWPSPRSRLHLGFTIAWQRDEAWLRATGIAETLAFVGGAGAAALHHGCGAAQGRGDRAAAGRGRGARSVRRPRAVGGARTATRGRGGRRARGDGSRDGVRRPRSARRPRRGARGRRADDSDSPARRVASRSEGAGASSSRSFARTATRSTRRRWARRSSPSAQAARRRSWTGSSRARTRCLSFRHGPVLPWGQYLHGALAVDFAYERTRSRGARPSRRPARRLSCPSGTTGPSS